MGLCLYMLQIWWSFLCFISKYFITNKKLGNTGLPISIFPENKLPLRSIPFFYVQIILWWLSQEFSVTFYFLCFYNAQKWLKTLPLKRSTVVFSNNYNMSRIWVKFRRLILFRMVTIGSSGYTIAKRRLPFGGKSLTWKKFLCLVFFGLFATQLLVLRDRSSQQNSQSLLNFWMGDGSSREKPQGSKSYHQVASISEYPLLFFSCVLSPTITIDCCDCCDCCEV